MPKHQKTYSDEKGLIYHEQPFSGLEISKLVRRLKTAIRTLRLNKVIDHALFHKLLLKIEEKDIEWRANL